MSRWLRLTKAGGLAVGAAAAGVGAVIAAEKIAVGRLRLRPDPAADEPLGQLRGRPLTVLADDGVPLHAEVAGPDDAAVTIVFTHGYTLTQDCWHYQRQGLEEPPGWCSGTSAATGARRACGPTARPVFLIMLNAGDDVHADEYAAESTSGGLTSTRQLVPRLLVRWDTSSQAN